MNLVLYLDILQNISRNKSLFGCLIQLYFNLPFQANLPGIAPTHDCRSRVMHVDVHRLEPMNHVVLECPSIEIKSIARSSLVCHKLTPCKITPFLCRRDGKLVRMMGWDSILHAGSNCGLYRCPTSSLLARLTQYRHAKYED